MFGASLLEALDQARQAPAVTRHIRSCLRHPSHSAQMTSWRLLQTLMDALSFQARETILWNPACGCAICGAGGNLLDHQHAFSKHGVV